MVIVMMTVCGSLVDRGVSLQRILSVALKLQPEQEGCSVYQSCLRETS